MAKIVFFLAEKTTYMSTFLAVFHITHTFITGKMHKITITDKIQIFFYLGCVHELIPLIICLKTPLS